MLPGVTPEELTIIKNILKRYSAEFFAYGSRVKGDFTPISDLDILVKSDCFEKLLPDLKTDFDNSTLAYIVNFADYNSISNHFYELIKQDLVKL